LIVHSQIAKNQETIKLRQCHAESMDGAARFCLIYGCNVLEDTQTQSNGKGKDISSLINECSEINDRTSNLIMHLRLNTIILEKIGAP
jgi:hypothetical protein